MASLIWRSFFRTKDAPSSQKSFNLPEIPSSPAHTASSRAGAEVLFFLEPVNVEGGVGNSIEHLGKPIPSVAAAMTVGSISTTSTNESDTREEGKYDNY